jgi:dihydrodipicolinate synthase/N-acetylneuraminate lyase
MTTPTPILRGVLAVFQTPFNDDETIDFDTLKREIDYIYAHGADGIVMAMVSETLRLTESERMALAEAACAFNQKRGSVVISVGAESTFAAEGFTRHAQRSGASGVMAIPPVATAAGEDELRRYYARLIRCVDIPVVIQDASGYVGKPMSIALQAGLFNEFGPRVMFKPEAAPIGQRLSALRDATGGAAAIFEGSGGIALAESYRRGIAGTMPGAEMIDVIVALWRALQRGDEAAVGRISPLVAAIVSLQQGLDGFLAVEKHLLKRRGIFKNELVRGPVSYRLDDETRAEVDRLIERLAAEIA